MLQAIVNWIKKLLGMTNHTVNHNTIDHSNEIDTLNRYQYVQKNIMTNSERMFYNKIRSLTDEYIIIPQLQLGAIIQRVGEHRFQNELNRRVDFGIFNKNYELIILIELDDTSHNKQNRKRRDHMVKTICSKCNIKLITFYTNMPNEQEYVINRILSTITGTTTIISVEDHDSEKK